jgi:hypothetical protein
MFAFYQGNLLVKQFLIKYKVLSSDLSSVLYSPHMNFKSLTRKSGTFKFPYLKLFYEMTKNKKL